MEQSYNEIEVASGASRRSGRLKRVVLGVAAVLLCLLPTLLVPAGPWAAHGPIVQTVARVQLPIVSASPEFIPQRYGPLEQRFLIDWGAVGRALDLQSVLHYIGAQADARSAHTPVAVATSPSVQPGFLACLRSHESDNAGGYRAVNSGGYYGAYQFSQDTWDNTARHIGRIDLIGIRPDRATPGDQDLMARALHAWQGSAPWSGDGC